MDFGMKVLVVDDFATMRRIVRNILKQLGFMNIVEADDGATALEIMKSDKIDLVLCDWNMPKISGLELLKQMKADSDLKNIPFLMITAEAQKQNIIEAVKTGVSNYIVKPFTADTIAEKLKKVFGE